MKLIPRPNHRTHKTVQHCYVCPACSTVVRLESRRRNLRCFYCDTFMLEVKGTLSAKGIRIEAEGTPSEVEGKTHA